MRFIQIKFADSDAFFRHVKFFGTQIHIFYRSNHVLPNPFIHLAKLDIVQLQRFQVNFKATFFISLFWAGKKISDELVIPNSVCSVSIDVSIFQGNIFQIDFIFQEKPVCEVYLGGTCIQQSVFFLIFYQYTFDLQLIEKFKINSLDRYFCM